MQKLVTALIFSFSQFDKEFILSKDSSYFPNGYILIQVHGGRELPVCYGGGALQTNELKLHITHKEGLAVIEEV